MTTSSAAASLTAPPLALLLRTACNFEVRHPAASAANPHAL